MVFWASLFLWSLMPGLATLLPGVWRFQQLNSLTGTRFWSSQKVEKKIWWTAQISQRKRWLWLLKSDLVKCLPCCKQITGEITMKLYFYLYVLYLVQVVVVGGARKVKKNVRIKTFMTKSSKQKQSWSYASISCLCVSRQAGSLGLSIFIYFISLTEQQSWYATNRFLYILITSTSWCERMALDM